MQNKNVDEMSDYIIDEMCAYFKNRIKDFVIKDLVDDVNHKTFSIEFSAYEYFPIIFHYDMGRIGYNICFGTRIIALEGSQKWWDEADFNILFQELKEELELRIPDKFLKAHGWL